MAKAFMAVIAAFVVAALVAKAAHLQSSPSHAATSNRAWAQNRMEFVAWNNSRWTAWVNDGAFEKLPAAPGKWHRHANTTIAFQSPDGRLWQAKIDGDEFLLAENGDWKGEVTRSSAVRYRDWAGNEQVRTVAQLQR